MKIIKDLIHGYIEIDSFEEGIISTLNFQRLKDICQLTAQHAYPSATHNRFEHSLGVMYLSKKAFINLKELLCSNYKMNIKTYEKLFLHLSIASLLHDIGHAPFSHLGELYFRKKEIIEEINKTIEKLGINIDINIFKKGSNHELMSCYIILTNYIDIIRNHYNFDFELICRCIIGNLYLNSAKWMENIIIQVLNSNTIDTDKLDYLMRDAYMTGITVPEIDTERLFRNIFINPRTKDITFFNRALPVIQNIIDARDSLYLWVYNHHTVVYTDFIMEFYIKHLIYNFEHNQFKDQLDPVEFFSCDAIRISLVSCGDLYSKLKSPLKNLSSSEISNYTKAIFPQLFERKFLKPLWKTIYEYKKFLEDNISDINVIRDLISKMCDNDYSYRRYVVRKIIESINLNHGELFIVPRSNKFYSLNPNNIFSVYLGDGDIDISRLLPQKDFSELYQNVAFYVFVRPDKIQEVREKFIDIVKYRLPNKEEILDTGTQLKWFDYK